MKISIITVVRNRAGTIGDAIKSVLTQTHDNIEHIIQDALSDDGTLEVIEQQKDPRIRLFSEKDSGIFDAMNRGITKATGDAIGFVHSDDFLSHNRVLAKIAAAFADGSVGGVYGDLDYVDKNNPQKITRHWKSGRYTPQKLRRGWMPPHPTLYLRRHVFQQYGLFKPAYRVSADYDAIVRYLVKGQIKLAYVPEVFIKMRTGGNSNQDLRNELRKRYEDLMIIRRNGLGGMGTLVMKNACKLRQFSKYTA